MLAPAWDRASIAAGNGAGPGKLWSLWDIMKQFNVGPLGSSYATLMQMAERAGHAEKWDGVVPADWIQLCAYSLEKMTVIAIVLGLTETRDCIRRLQNDHKQEIAYATFQHGLTDFLKLMQSELEKRKIFSLDQELTKYFRDLKYGIAPPVHTNALQDPSAPPRLFGEKAENAFPSAYMDVVEAGRCLALNRNNAAVYHLMQVAEVGLRALAWDRRAIVKRGKKQIHVPLDYAQWGEMIGALKKKEELIDQWNRSKHLREEAKRFYSTAIFEVDSFNEIYRKHISHARNEPYEMDVAVSCWGHVKRFMERLSERISEDKRTPLVWSKTMLSS